ncbi:MAG: hypothetical protein ABSF44_10270 [Candidatus Bathyarchaeia archaeon]|jgi:hypothetical protein
MEQIRKKMPAISKMGDLAFMKAAFSSFISNVLMNVARASENTTITLATFPANFLTKTIGWKYAINSCSDSFVRSYTTIVSERFFFLEIE